MTIIQTLRHQQNLLKFFVNIAFEDSHMQTIGLKMCLLARAYADGGLSLGQLARTLDKSYADIAKLLTLLDIPVLDYDLADEINTLENIT